MESRIVDLNISERPAVEIKISDRSFLIRRVVIGVQRLWAEYVAETVTYMELVGKYAEQEKALQAEGTPESLEKLTALAEEITREVDEFSNRKLDAVHQIIELLITKNGYAFDRQWWADNADFADCRDFIVASLTKDAPEVKKKREAGEEK